MNKIYLDEEAYEYLCKWAEGRKTAVKFSPYYFKKVKVILKKYDFDFYAEATNYGYKVSMLDSRGIAVKGKITHDETGEHDFSLSFSFGNIGEENKEIYKRLFQLYCTAFIQANCFMWYGNLAESKKYVASGRNEGRDKTITFRKFNDSVYAVECGLHRSPEGIFSVRGHFRKYKSGKVIWIDEYLKGIKDEE
ncbi:MAG: hypothetical protein ACI4RU_06695 [Acutalibacteraceae bacterium]